MMITQEMHKLIGFLFGSAFTLYAVGVFGGRQAIGTAVGFIEFAAIVISVSVLLADK
jgi:hypothetical protein